VQHLCTVHSLSRLYALGAHASCPDRPADDAQGQGAADGDRMRDQRAVHPLVVLRGAAARADRHRSGAQRDAGLALSHPVPAAPKLRRRSRDGALCCLVSILIFQRLDRQVTPSVGKSAGILLHKLASAAVGAQGVVTSPLIISLLSLVPTVTIACSDNCLGHRSMPHIPTFSRNVLNVELDRFCRCPSNISFHCSWRTWPSSCQQLHGSAQRCLCLCHSWVARPRAACWPPFLASCCRVRRCGRGSHACAANSCGAMPPNSFLSESST